jgi:hypothetical protein
MNQSIPADPSPTIDDIHWLGARTVMLACQKCPHLQVVNIDLLPDAVPLALVASKFVRPKCHQNGAHAVPNWDVGAKVAAPPRLRQLQFRIGSKPTLMRGSAEA